MKQRLLWGLIGVLCSLAVRASHIAGGNIEFIATDKPNQFRLSLNLYIDEASKGPDAEIASTITLSIFRQRDHQLMGDYSLNYLRRLVLVYANPACARSRGLETSEVKYSGLVQLDPARFADPGGYYIVWEKCCRNKNVVNVQLPETAGMIYYVAFPPLRRNGQAFRNSSPVFLTPNAEYICLDKPFSLAFRATDADGDELRYSLVTPYNDNIYKPYGFANSPASPPYRLLRWATGFGPDQAISGNPALQISSSGVLTVRPNKVGLFVFTVLCEEFRAGEKIGEVRRDHQILVVDCSPQVPPKPSLVALEPTGSSPIAFCPGNSVVLRTDTDTAFNYQWRINGYNLPGQTKSTLRATEPGDYSVIKSFATICTRDSVSDAFTLIYKPSSRADITTLDTLLCPNQSLSLLALSQANAQYQWLLNNTQLPGATTNQLTATRPGLYKIRIANPTTGCTSFDSITVLKSPLEQVVLQVPGSSPLCEGQPLTATVTQSSSLVTYTWQRNGQILSTATGPVLTATKPGDYILTVRDTVCSLSSALATVNPNPHPVIDSIPPVCGVQARQFPLRATPLGGEFSGPGVSGNQFVPKVAGLGQHRVKYTVTTLAGCQGDTSRVVQLVDAPILNLGLSQTMIIGSSVQLSGPLGPGLTYQWQPTDQATDATHPTLTVRPTQTTTYQLTVWRDGVCPQSGEVQVDVLPGLFIPTAFSPNGDGLNDTWELTGIDNFPYCHIQVFNRWGEVIYDSITPGHSWDGQCKGQPVGPGVYPFIIQPAPGLPERRGSVTIF